MGMIGQYELRGLIGEGGIGQVQGAFDTVLEREVAIKSLRPELLSDKSLLDRFRGEATSLARLNHPNITTLYQLLPEDRNLYMVMELVRGDTLDALLKKRNGALGVQESLAIVAQAADGLSYAHSMGVIHRDIKPANLMITDAGLLKVMDFGIARIRGSQRLTRDGNMVGTLAYMSPEQLRGEPGDERSDLYSLAIVLYELLCGHVPFEAASDYELMQAHMNTRPQRLLHRVPGLDAKVDAALMRALAKKAEERFESVRAFSDALGATALRVDASKIVLDATRLLSPIAADAAPASPTSGSFERLSATADRLAPWLPEAIRIPALVGASTFATASVLLAGFFMLMPSPVPTSAPAKVTTSLAPPPTSPPPVITAEASATPPSRSVAVPPVTATPTNPAPLANTKVALATSEPIGEPPLKPKVATASDPQPPTGEMSNSTPSNPIPTESTPSTPKATKGDLAAAFSRKAYAEAFELAGPLAAGGDRDAQFSVAWLYDQGEGVSRDNEKAAAWYEKAAEQGHVLAQYNLGALYEQGRGVGQSDEQALKWYRKAADQNDADAQNQVAIMYALGLGTRKDEFEAVMWFAKAAKQGLAKAQKNLADMHATGRGVERDDREALRLYRQAAEQRHPDAEYSVGSLYEAGRAGLKRDYDVAAQWYGRAAEHGSTKARDALDRLRSRGRIRD
jgi:eukaryotic-like serine/threonine-protein kinase